MTVCHCCMEVFPLITQLYPSWMICSSGADPLIHYGQHFGCTIHTIWSVHAVIVSGLLHAAKIAELELGPNEALDDK